MTVAIVGSRGLEISDFSPYLPPQTAQIVSGGAKGIDQGAAEYARARGIAVKEIFPQYALYGRAAPILRNKEIVQSADLVLLFWDGTSKGTKSSLALCKKEGTPYRLYVFQKEEGVFLLTEACGDVF